MKMIKRMFRFNLRKHEIILAKKFAAAFVISIFVVQMTLPNVLLADVTAVADEPVAGAAEETPVADEPVAEVAQEAPAAEEPKEEPVVEPKAVEAPAVEEPAAPVLEETPVVVEEVIAPEQPLAAPVAPDAKSGSAKNTLTADAPRASLLAITPLAAVSPSVTSTSPVNGASNVSLNVSALGVTFNTSINCDTMNGGSNTFILKDSNNQQVDSMGINCIGPNASFSIRDPLANNMTYTATIVGGANGVKSLVGNLPMASNYNWSFTTPTLNDAVAPTVVSVNPLNGATGISLNSTIIRANFSEYLLDSSLNYANFFVKDAQNNDVGAMSLRFINVNHNAIELSLANPLVNNKTYTAYLTSGIKDLAGNSLAPYSWSFSTTTLNDAVAPTVVSVSPLGGATNVALNTMSIQANFSEPMLVPSVNFSSFFIKDGQNNNVNPVSINFTNGGTSASLQLGADLIEGTTYTVTIVGGANGVKDLAGNALAANHVWTFTTVPRETVVPFVTSTSPVAGSTVSLDSTIIRANFSEALLDSSLDSANFFVTDNQNNNVRGMSFNFANNKTAIELSLANPLINNKTYTVSLTSGIKDLAGNSLAPYSWTFSTPVLNDAVAPEVFSTNPTAGEANVPLNTTSIQVNFSEPVQNLTYDNFFIVDDLANMLSPMGLISSVDKTSANLTFGSDLDNNRTYTATVTGVKDLADNAMATSHVWSFSTTTLNDAVAPTVVTVSPTGIGVPLNSTTIQVNFSEPILPSSVDYANFFIKDSLGAEALPMGIELVNGGMTLNLTLAEILKMDKTYNVTVTTGIKDLAGNPLAANYTWSFSTNLTGAVCQTTADTSGDGIVSISEISSYVNAWKSGAVSISLVSQAVQFWKAGSGC